MRLPRRILLTVLTASLALPSGPALAEVLPSSCETHGLSVTALHGPRFYVDLSTSPVLRGAYAGYRVAELSGEPRKNIWIQLRNFTGGSVALGDAQPDSQQIPALGAAASSAEFFYLTGAVETTVAQQHDVVLWQGRPGFPGSTALCSTAGGFTSVDGTIKAAANKLSSVAVSTDEPRIGSTFSVTVNGSTGTIGDGTSDDPRSFWMSPAALGNWPASAYRLESTQLSFDDGTAHQNTLRVRDLASPSKNYTAVYTFRAVGFTAAATQVLPVQQIASGTQIKHTDVGSVASLPGINPATNDLQLSVTATPTKLPDTGGRIHVVVDVAGSPGAVLDSVEDRIPAGTTVVADSVTWNGQPQEMPVEMDSTLYFQGPFTLGGGGDTLEFDLDIPPAPGTKTNSVVARIGAAQIDSTLDLTDDAPATTYLNVNTPPTAPDVPVTASGGSAITVDVLAHATDQDGDDLVVAHVGTPTQGSATTDGASVTYTAAQGSTGQDSFDYTVADGRGGTSTGTVTVQLSATPAPSVGKDTASVTPGQTTTIPVLENDAGSDLTVTGVTGLGAAVSADGTGVVFTAPTEPGEYVVTYTVTDGEGRVATGQIVITVTAPADPPATAAPVAQPDEVSTRAGRAVRVPVLANDHGTGLQLQKVGPADHGKTTLEAVGSVRYTPADDFVGTDEFRYTGVDSEGRAFEGLVRVEVTEGPAGVDDETTAPWQQPVLVDVLANDPKGARVAKVDGQPSHGTATVLDGKVRYVPSPGFAGVDHFTYRLVGSRVSATVSVTVHPPALAAEDDRVSTTRAAGEVPVAVLSNDTGTSLRVESITQPRHGTATFTADGMRYTPAPDFTGEDTLTYTVRDAVGRTAKARVTVLVENVVPTIAPLPRTTTTSGDTVRVPVVSDDADGDRLQVRLARAVDSSGRPVPVAARTERKGTTLRVDVGDDVSGRLTLTVTVADGHGGTAERALRLVVSPEAVHGIRGQVVKNPAARRSLARPRFLNGRPVSRIVSRRVDSKVIWRRSPTASVSAYRVLLNGERVCRTREVSGNRQSCVIRRHALDPRDNVRVVAVGADGVTSGRSRVPVRRSSEGHLVSVVYFPTGRFHLDRSAVRTLASLVRQASRAGYSAVTMAGHTDSDGSGRYNLRLSRQRAREVQQYLLRRTSGLQVPATTGYGETRPATTNATSRGKAGNRRVEIYVR